MTAFIILSIALFFFSILYPIYRMERLATTQHTENMTRITSYIEDDTFEYLCTISELPHAECPCNICVEDRAGLPF